MKSGLETIPLFLLDDLLKAFNKLFYPSGIFLGKTEEARADLARLAIIRKQREDAAKKRDEEKKGDLNFDFIIIIISFLKVYKVVRC